ncbi:MAG TPA: DUF1206 domain-containing protein [Propionibacterium sp.]|nr:DUF1206 domain-containing protein [Propionibacterium sp.]
MGGSETAQAAADKGKDAARRVEQSTAYQGLVKVGLVFYGLVHLLIAWLAIQLALGNGGGEEASNTGALRSLAETPLGAGLLWVVAVGFFALVVWQLVSAAIGFHEFDGFKRLRKRVSAALRAVLYGYLGFASAQIAAGSGADEGGGDSKESLSQGLLSLPFGQLLVGIVGLAVVGYGIGQIVKAFRTSFHDDLDTTLTGKSLRLTQAGFVAKGIAIGIVGALFLWAAVTADPEKAGGMDQALQRVLEQPFGSWLLIALAMGVGAYGIYCFFWARHPKHA